MMLRASVLTLALAAPLAAQQPTPQPGRQSSDSAIRAAAADTLAARRTLDSLRRQADSLRVVVRRDTVLRPLPNDALGLDAEVRAALYELLGDQVVPALARLQRTIATPVALTAGSGSTALRNRQDLLFLLAEAQYRFGMDSAFRTTAETVMRGGAPARYTSLLGAQLVMAAYRSGDYARAAQLARQGTDAATRPLTALVGGLASYQLRDYTGARASFANAAQAGGALAPYAQYMGILTSLRGDSSGTAAASALQGLQSLAGSASGTFADQVRSTAAQLAYERGAFDQAISFANGVSADGGYAAGALLTKAWAQYKAGQVEAAGQTFAAFANRYPQLPARDESRLMAAQALLQGGKTDDAGRIFTAVADSAATEARALEARAQQAMTTAARALVQARAAGLLFINDPALGKTVAVSDVAGADRQALVSAVSDTAHPTPLASDAALVSLTDVQRRLAGVDSITPDLPRRVFYTPASNPSGAYGTKAQALFAADLAVSTARYALEQQLVAYRARIALMEALQANLASYRSTLDQFIAQYATTRAQLQQVLAQLDAAAGRIRVMLTQQATLTRQAADENQHALDSLRQTWGGGMSPADRELVAIEAQTIDYYRQLADLVTSRVDTAIRHHPVLVLRDSVRARGLRVDSLLSGTQNALATAIQLATDALTRLRTSEPGEVTRARGALASAEGGRGAAEAQLVAAVDAELRARAGEMLADLRRDGQAAEFGSASASFFQAIDQTRTTGGTGATGTTGSTAGDGVGARAREAAVVSTRTPNQKQ